jgi:hypothetical protein
MAFIEISDKIVREEKSLFRFIKLYEWKALITQNIEIRFSIKSLMRS